MFLQIQSIHQLRFWTRIYKRGWKGFFQYHIAPLLGRLVKDPSHLTKKILTRLINHILIAGLNYCEKYLTFSSRKKKSTSKWGKWNIILNPLKVQKYRYTAMEPCILRRSENVFLHLKIKPGKVLWSHENFG